MTYAVKLYTSNRVYTYHNVNKEVIKDDKEHGIKWYILKNTEDKYVAKFRLDWIECVSYPVLNRCLDV